MASFGQLATKTTTRRRDDAGGEIQRVHRFNNKNSIEVERKRAIGNETLKSKRKKFVMNHSLTLGLVALLLVLAFVELDAQDAVSNARRVLVSPDVQMKHLEPPPSPNPQPLLPSSLASQFGPSPAGPQLRGLTPSKPTSPNLSRTRPQEDPLPAALALQDHDDILAGSNQPRQTRSTTRRRLLSTSSTTTTTPTPSNLSSSSDGQVGDSKQQQSDTEQTTTTSTTSKPPPSGQSAPSSQRPRVKAAEPSDWSDADHDERQADLERANRRRLKHRRKKQESANNNNNNNSTTTTSSPTTTTTTTTASSTTTSSATTTEVPLHKQQQARRHQSSSNKTSANKHLVTGKAAGKAANATITTTTTGDLIYDDDDDEDEDYEEEPRERLTAATVKAASSTTTTTSTTSTTTRRPKLDTYNKPNLGQEHLSTTHHLLHSNSSSVGSNDTYSVAALEGRSPGSLKQRLSELIAEQKGKILRSTASPSVRVVHAKPASADSAPSHPVLPSMLATSTTTSTTTPAPIQNMLVQVVNQTDGASSSELASNATQGHNLDWSKLAKVVFKSAKDNQTVYTVVMNSSELRNHPISDWSHELPHLLEKDFEKLVQKWSTVFPPLDHLMSDLARMLATKVTFNISAAPSSMEKSTALSSGSTPLEHQTAHNLLVGPLDRLLNSTARTNSSNTTANLLTGPDNRLANVPMSNISSSSQPLAVPPSTTNKTILIATTLRPTPMNANSNQTAVEVSPGSSNVTGPPKVDSIQPKPGVIGHPDLFSGAAAADNDTAQHLTTSPPATKIDSTTSSAINISKSDITKAPPVILKSHNATDWSADPNHNKVTTARPNDNKLLKQTVISQKAGESSGNKTMHEIIEDIREENLKIEDNVKEQGSSLRHFIIICSVSVVVATSLVVALVVLLFK